MGHRHELMYEQNAQLDIEKWCNDYVNNMISENCKFWKKWNRETKKQRESLNKLFIWPNMKNGRYIADFSQRDNQKYKIFKMLRLSMLLENRALRNDDSLLSGNDQNKEVAWKSHQ